MSGGVLCVWGAEASRNFAPAYTGKIPARMSLSNSASLILRNRARSHGKSTSFSLPAKPTELSNMILLAEKREGVNGEDDYNAETDGES